MKNLAQEIRFSLRTLLKSPGFSLAAITTLAIGIGAIAVLYSILDGAYIHANPTEQENRAVILKQEFTGLKSESWLFSAPEYFDIAAGVKKAFDGVFANSYVSLTLEETTAGAGNPERVPVVRATANMFQLYGMYTIYGRLFTAEEDRPGGENVAVVTYRLWERRFRKDPRILGKTIKLDGIAYTIVGITQRRFQQWGADIFVPFHLDSAVTDRSQRTLRVAGIPKIGVSQDQIQQALQLVARTMEKEYRGSNPEYSGLIYVPLNIRNVVIGDLRRALYILLAAASLLIIIAGANIGNLLLARVISRSGDIGIRLALGATSFGVARQFLIESLLLGGIAGIIGCGLGTAALNPTLALIPEYFIAEEAEIHASPVAFAIGVLVSLILAVAFGLIPALFLARRGAAENLLLRRTRSVTDKRGGRARLALVCSEIAIAFVVVAASGLMVRSYQQLTSLDFGFRRDHVLTMQIALPELKYRSAGEVTGFFQNLSARVQGLPAVSAVAVASSRPLDGVASRDFTIPGRSLSPAGGMSNAEYRVVSPGYFATVGTPLRKGRVLEETDGPRSMAVALVNESFVHIWFPNEDPVGKQIQLQNLYGRDINPEAASTVQIVGVVGDSKRIDWGHLQDLNQVPLPEIYVPFRQHPNRDMALLLRTNSDPGALTDAVRNQVLGIDPGQPIYDVETLEQATTEALGPARLALGLLSTFGGIALLIASVGLYAIVAYSVAQRTQEIGIRMAIGAHREQILLMVISQGLRWSGMGLIAGLVASVGLTRLMSSLLYGVQANDIGTLLAVSAVLLGVAVLASVVPAVRATKVDPMVALRYE